VLLLSLTFNPDNVSTAQIMAAIAEDFQQKGHTVRVITTTPHYNRDVSLEAKQPLRWACFPFIKKSSLGNIPVYHICMPSKRVWTPIRLLSWIWFHFVSVLFGLLMCFRPQVVLTCSPPITIGIAAWLIAVCHRAKMVYTVQELYPDIAVNLGYLKHKGLIRFFAWMERFIYRHAAAVTSITPAMCEKIAGRVDPKKVHLIENFVDLPSAEERIASTTTRDHDGLVITYAGNMGVPQNLGLLVEAVATMEGVKVWFVGEGGDKARLMARAKALGVFGSKVLFDPYLPISQMPRIYASSDLFYVAQDPKACSDGIPSKLYRILGNEKPLLVVTDASSDMAQFVRSSGGGYVVGDFSIETLQGVIMQAQANREGLRVMASTGYQYVAKHLSRQTITDKYIDVLTSTLEAPAS
jgi:colanic acid biosynthesis glycosyl transferase WcaI